ncbi:hypothetical protein ACRS6O_17265 [Bacillus cytotoxicus]|uniref:hypothetical protein n=1 Tax=Bacillus cytotoxicus TaxID=580165 RepID=UPI003D7E6845
MTLRVMAEIGNEKELNKSSLLIGSDLDAIKMTLEFHGKMKQRNIEITLEELEFTRASFGYFNIQDQMNTPMVHCAPAGFGKSTMLEIWGTYNGLNKSPLWGAIVAKPKVEQVIEFTNEVNAQVSGTATALIGRENVSTDEDYQKQFELQEYTPMIVMTHKMLETLVSQKRLQEFSRWVDHDGNARRRTTLIIDERPRFTETVELTPATIEKLVDLVRNVSIASEGEEGFYYWEVKNMAQKLQNELKKPVQKGARTVYTIQAIDPLWKVPEKLQNDWLKFTSLLGEDNHTLLGTFEEAIKRGGTCQVSGSKGNMETTLTLGRMVWQEVTFMNTHILDGTAMGDENYKFRAFNKIAPIIPKNAYSNTTIKNCYKHNLGKMFFDNNKTAIDKTVKLAKEVSRNHRRLLVVVYQKYLPKYEKKLAKELAMGTIKLKHFDDERSTNDFADCDAVLFLGIHRKAMGYYPEIARLVNDEEVNAEHTTQGGLKFTCDPVQGFFIADQVTDRLQGIARTRNYKSETPVTVYMFSMDKEIPERITEEFEGATLEEWKLPFSLTDTETKETASDKFKGWLQGFATQTTGSSIKKKEVYVDVLGIGRTQWSEIQKSDEILSFMDSLGIEFKGHSIIKR